VCEPIIVFSLGFDQAEQHDFTKLNNTNIISQNRLTCQCINVKQMYHLMRKSLNCRKLKKGDIQLFSSCLLDKQHYSLFIDVQHSAHNL
jgi:hypothetical protein